MSNNKSKKRKKITAGTSDAERYELLKDRIKSILYVAPSLKETAEYIDKKNRQRMAKADKTSDGDGFVSEPFIDYQSDEYIIIFIYRKVSST